MRACGRGALGGLPPQARRRGGRSGGDAPHRRTASRTSVLRLAANDLRTQQGRPWGQPQAGAAADAGDGDRGAGSAPRHEQSRARAQDIPLPAARPEDCRAEPRVGGRRDLHPDGVRLPLSGGDHRLGQPGGSGMAAVEHQRCELLRGGAGGGAASVRKAADFQYRSGLHFHRRGFHRQARDGRRRDFDGRTRPLHGQHFHRTAVALDQVRRSASESLRRWPRGAVRHQFLDDLLQPRIRTPICLCH